MEERGLIIVDLAALSGGDEFGCGRGKKLGLQEDDHDMDVDSSMPAVQTPAKSSVPELEIYCYLLVLIFLIHQKKLMSYELTGSLAEIRGNLLALHRMAKLCRDELGQGTLLNLLLCNYLHYNLYDQAEKLSSVDTCSTWERSEPFS